jgi:predicted DNA-binding protein
VAGRKVRQIVVRLPKELETQLENAVARYGAPYGVITRVALRKHLTDISEAEIRAELADDQRKTKGGTANAARIRLEQLRNG